MRVCRSRNCRVYGSWIKIFNFVAQAIPEVTFNGQWLAEKISDNIVNLTEMGLCVQGIVTDNYSANIDAFSALIKLTLGYLLATSGLVHILKQTSSF